MSQMHLGEDSPIIAGATVQSSLRELVALVRRRWWIMVACIVIGGAVAAALAVTAQSKYSATSALLFGGTTVPSAAAALQGAAVASAGSTGNPVIDQATELDLINLENVDALVAKAIGSVTPGDVRQDVSIVPSGQSNLVTVTATTNDPALSQRMANSFARQFVQFRQGVDSAPYVAAENQARTLLNALPASELNGTQGRTLRAEAETLSLEASLQSSDVQIVQQAALPTTPSSPRKKRDIALGLLGGLVVAIIAALAIDQFDSKLRDWDEVGEIIGAPVVGTVPKSAGLELNSSPTANEIEAFHLLRANLQVRPGGGRTKTVLVTSAEPDDGKSTVSYYLAVAAALAGLRVILVDGDLRKIGRFKEPVGLTQVLSGQKRMESVIVDISQKVAGTTLSAEFDAIPSGRLRNNPVELLAGDALADVIDICQRSYDLTIIDSPPATLVSDAALIAQVVPDVLVVTRAKKTRRAALRRLEDRLRLMGAHTLGVVINGVPLRGAYGYGYGDPVSGEIELDDAELAGSASVDTNNDD